ncbi:glycosyltransferase [archaeon]|jgi:L-malate glycosyltransferase|nr:glycosyltransferase [archaeon]
MLVSPYYGGVVTVVSHLISELDREKYDISLVFDPNFPEIDVRLKNARLIPIRLRGKGFLFDILKLYNIFRKEKFDIVHSHNSKTHIIGIILSYMTGVRNRICTVHEDLISILKSKDKYNYFNIFIYKLVFRISHRVICVSNSTLEKNKALFLKNNTIVIRNGFNQNIYNNDAISSNDNTVLTYLGRLEHDKGLHILIEALKFVNDKKNISLQIIGGSYNDLYVEKLKKQIIKSKLQNIYFYGVLKDFSNFLIKTDIVIVPSLLESMGYSILDAWSFRKAVIASNTDGIPEVITNNKNGLLFQKNNSSELAQKIDYLIKNPQKRKFIGENGFKKLKSDYSVNKFVSNMDVVYLHRTIDKT